MWLEWISHYRFIQATSGHLWYQLAVGAQWEESNNEGQSWNRGSFLCTQNTTSSLRAFLHHSHSHTHKHTLSLSQLHLKLLLFIVDSMAWHNNFTLNACVLDFLPLNPVLFVSCLCLEPLRHLCSVYCTSSCSVLFQQKNEKKEQWGNEYVAAKKTPKQTKSKTGKHSISIFIAFQSRSSFRNNRWYLCTGSHRSLNWHQSCQPLSAITNVLHL